MDNGPVAALEKSINDLNEFLNSVVSHYPLAIAFFNAKHALNYQKEFYNYIKDFGFDEEIYKELMKLKIRYDGVSTNFYEAMCDLIEFYNIVIADGYSTPNMLKRAWDALSYQYNLTDRMSKGVYINIGLEGICNHRPITPRINLPVRPA